MFYSMNFRVCIVILILITLSMGGIFGRFNIETEKLKNEIARLKVQINQQEEVIANNNKITLGNSTNGNLKISLTMPPFAFELPQGYAIFQQELFEGGYGTTLSVGKKVNDAYLKYAPLQIELLLSAYDHEYQRSYKPSEYVDAIFNDRNKRHREQIKLFGNSAVRYMGDADDSITIIGYITSTQLPKLPQEYLVRITSSTYGRGGAFDKNLFDTVVNTLHIVQ